MNITSKGTGFRPVKCATCGHANKFRRSNCSSCGRKLPPWNNFDFWALLVAIGVIVYIALG
ncbi:hypothetical protein ROE7235_01466 [Roseibaca ekhonensis]|uniref:Uncharacterized protein n=1 Tax=Roseinatronobacter ekhonensis TaxID=254356 RepID=A0A3B0MV76_9RHOB|nr:hypothetical protein ROE7235_01466 [Roseibaca ekhonensis]